MSQQIATSPEQGKRILACGVDPNTADMTWQTPITTSQKRIGEKILVLRHPNYHDYVGDVPAWSLGRIMAILPKIIICDFYGYIWLEIMWLYEENSIPTIRYFTPPNENDDEPDQWEFTDESIIECAVQVVEWIQDNGYKLNEIK